MVLSESRPDPLGTRPRSLVLVLTSLEPGGAEAQVTDVGVALSARGWEVTVVSLTEPTSYVDVLTAGGVDVVSLGMRHGRPDPRGAVRLVRLLRTRRPDVLHAHMFHANMLARSVVPLVRVPVVVNTIHSVLEGGPSRDLAYRLTDALADVTTAVSRAAAERYLSVRAVSPHRVLVVPNGIDLDRFRPATARRDEVRRELGVQGRFVWLAAGRLDPAKDYDTMLSAFALARKRCNQGDPVLLIAGGGPRQLRSFLAERIAELGLVGHVELLGHREDVVELLRVANGYVMTSNVEGLPMALLEAAATALPIVATDVGGNGEIVVDGETGLLVPPGDPWRVATALTEVMGLPPAARAELGRRARDHVAAKFSLETVVECWTDLYDRLEASSSGRR